MILQSSPIKTSIHRGFSSAIFDDNGGYLYPSSWWWSQPPQKMSSSIGSIIPFGWKTRFQTSHQMMILALDDYDISWWSRVLINFLPNILTLWSRRIATCRWRGQISDTDLSQRKAHPAFYVHMHLVPEDNGRNLASAANEPWKYPQAHRKKWLVYSDSMRFLWILA